MANTPAYILYYGRSTGKDQDGKEDLDAHRRGLAQQEQ
jgi:hypothetical protein